MIKFFFFKRFFIFKKIVFESKIVKIISSKIIISFMLLFWHKYAFNKDTILIIYKRLTKNLGKMSKKPE